MSPGGGPPPPENEIFGDKNPVLSRSPRPFRASAWSGYRAPPHHRCRATGPPGPRDAADRIPGYSQNAPPQAQGWLGSAEFACRRRDAPLEALTGSGADARGALNRLCDACRYTVPANETGLPDTSVPAGAGS
jgi:hypothetical protein